MNSITEIMTNLCNSKEDASFEEDFDSDNSLEIYINGKSRKRVEIDASPVGFTFSEHQFYREVATLEVPLILEDIMLFSGSLTEWQINSLWRYANWPYYGSTFIN